MPRVIAGTARGLRLAAPPGRSTRPTSDRTREGLFASLGSMVGPLAGLRVVDLYAGSGAVGLEALSRGAGHVTFVEAARLASRALRDNVRRLGMPGAEVIVGGVEDVVRRAPPGAAYDLVFADPPYALADDGLARVLVALRVGGWLADGALVVVERASRAGPPWPPGYTSDRTRRYGEATLWYGHAAPPL